MTFPTIPTVAAGRVLFANQADTSGTRTFPSLSSLTKNAGDRIIAIIVTYQSTTNPQFSGWGAGFTEISDQGTSSTLGIGVAELISTGSETGTFTVTQAGTITGHASMCLLSIPGAHASTASEVGTIANGTSAAADPGSFNPAGWDVEDTLWIAVDGNGMTSGTGSWTACGAGTLTNYTDLANSNTTDNSTVGQTEIAVAFRQVAAASEDRGAISTHDTSNARNSALIIAVRPAPAAQTVTQASRFDNSNTHYAHVVTGGAVTVTQSSRFDNSNTFYAATVSQGGGAQALTQASRFDNSASFYAAVVSAGAVTLTPSLFSNSNAFYAPTVSTGAVTVTAGLFSNSNTFYAATVSVEGGAQSLTPELFSNANTFYPATVLVSSLQRGGGSPLVDLGSYKRRLKERIEAEEPEVAQAIESIEEQIESVASVDAYALMRQSLETLGFAYKAAYREIYLELLAELKQQQEDEQMAMIVALML